MGFTDELMLMVWLINVAPSTTKSHMYVHFFVKSIFFLVPIQDMKLEQNYVVLMRSFISSFQITETTWELWLIVVVDCGWIFHRTKLLSGMFSCMLVRNILWLTNYGSRPLQVERPRQTDRTSLVTPYDQLAVVDKGFFAPEHW